VKMFDRQGAVHDVPDDQAQEAFQSGDFGFAPDAKIPVITRSGKTGTIDATNADAVFGRGGRMLLPEEAHEAEIQAKYGTGGGMAAAAGESFARGLTGDLSDPLAIGTARLLMGDEAAEATREHLAGEKEANPWTSTLGEMAGMAAPLLVPGGAAVEGAGAVARGAEGAGALAAGAEGLEAANALAKGAEGAQALTSPSAFGAAAQRLGQGVRAAGIVPRANVAMGELAGRAISKIVGKEASSAAGRITQKIAIKAGEAGVETALFSAEQEMDEEVLGNHDLNAEKILQAAGHGALLGGGTLGVLTAAGGLAREVAGKTAPMLEKLAGYQMWKAAAPKLKYSKEAIKRAGGVAEVGKAALEEGIRGSTIADLAEQTEAAVAKRASELKAQYANAPGSVTVKEVEDELNAIIDPLRKQPLYEKIVKGLDQAKEQIIGGLSPEISDAVAAVHTPKVGPVTREELEALAKEHGGGGRGSRFEKLYDPGEAGQALREKLGIKLNLHTLQMEWAQGVKPSLETITKAAEEARIPVSKLIDVRQALGDIAYKEARALDPNMRVEQLRKMYGRLSELEYKAMDRAEIAMGRGPMKAELQALRKRYQRLAIFKDALTDSMAKVGTNRIVSASDYVMAAGALATGHPIGAALTALGHKVLRERGSAWSAQVLHRIAAYGAIERATASVDRQIERGIAGFFSPGERAAVRVRRAARAAGSLEAAKSLKERDKDYQERVDRVARATAYADAHADQASRVADSIRQHTPRTAQSLESSILRVTSQLAKTIPNGHVPMDSLTPHLEKPRVSEADKAKFRRADDMANDPIGTTFSRMTKGQLTRTDVENLRNFYPQTYAQITDMALQALGSQTKKLDFNQRMQLGILLDLPADKALGPLLLPTLQQTFGPPAPEDEPKDRGTPPRRELKDMAKAVNLNSGLNDLSAD